METRHANGGAHAAKAQKIPPFLKKLVDLTNSCPPHIGSWNEDGTQFIVKSSQFADLLREQFQGTLQTFVRQLHFYSFNKKDDGATGTWTFSHANFLRGQPHLLVNIERKSNPKRNKNNHKDDEDDSAEKESNGDQANYQALEARLNYLERQVGRMHTLEREVSTLKQELVAFKELAAAQNLLSLAPGISKKRVSPHPDEPVKEKTVESPVNKAVDKDDNILSLLPPPKKVTRLTSVDSAFELKDFPFEDTSSLGSVSVRDLMRELQYGIFSDFDEFLPPMTKAYSSSTDNTVPATPMSETATDIQNPCSGNKEDYFNIPNGFVLQPGVTIPLLKQAFNVIAKLCCPLKPNDTPCSAALKNLCDELPHPSTLPAVEQCDVSRSLLPVLREGVDEEASDLALMRAARQVYEVYYATVVKKLQDKKECANRTPTASIGCNGAMSANYGQN